MIIFLISHLSGSLPPSPADSGVSDVDPSSSSQTSDEESKIHSRLQIHGKIRNKNDVFSENIFFYFLLVSSRLAVFFFTNFQLLRDLGEKFLYLQTRQSVRQVIIIKTLSNTQWKIYIFSPPFLPNIYKRRKEGKVF